MSFLQEILWDNSFFNINVCIPIKTLSLDQPFSITHQRVSPFIFPYLLNSFSLRAERKKKIRRSNSPVHVHTLCLAYFPVCQETRKTISRPPVLSFFFHGSLPVLSFRFTLQSAFLRYAPIDRVQKQSTRSNE